MVRNYLKVFRNIFEKTGHGGHYKMMMGDDFVDMATEKAYQQHADGRLLRSRR